MKHAVVFAPFFGSALMIALSAGCAVEDAQVDLSGDLSSEDDAASDDAASPGKGAPANLGPTWTEYAMPARGGGGGSSFPRITGPSVIYAVRISSGALVDSIQFKWCQPSDPNNRCDLTKDANGTTFSYGGGGGGNNGWYTCGNVGNIVTKGVIGIRGAYGNSIDRIGVVCGDVTSPNPTDPANPHSLVWGGGGGSVFTDVCPTGYLVDTFNIRSGVLLDNIQAICIRAQ